VTKAARVRINVPFRSAFFDITVPPTTDSIQLNQQTLFYRSLTEKERSYFAFPPIRMVK